MEGKGPMYSLLVEVHQIFPSNLFYVFLNKGELLNWFLLLLLNIQNIILFKIMLFYLTFPGNFAIINNNLKQSLFGTLLTKNLPGDAVVAKTKYR